MFDDLNYFQLEQNVDKLCLSLKNYENCLIIYDGKNPIEYWILFLVSKKLNLVLFYLNQRLSDNFKLKIINKLNPAIIVNENLVINYRQGDFYEDSGIIIQTSGSTGEPKYCLLSFDALDNSANAVINYFNLDSSAIWYFSIPAFHVGGLGILNRSYLLKSKVSYELKKSNIASLVPAQLKEIQNYNHLNYILVGGSSVSISYASKINSIYKNIYYSYGLSEFCSTVAIGREPDKMRFLENNKGKIIDGILYLKGTNKFNKYFFMDNQQIEYFRTNDIAEINNDFLKVLGRNDRVINSGGEKISPEIIENLINDNFNCKIAILKKVDEKWGERPIAVVDGDINLADLKKIIEQELGKIFIPDQFIFNKIPLTVIGKTDYLKLYEVLKKINTI